MSKIKDLPKFLRPREKLFEKGPDALKDHELLAILLRTGYQGKSAIEVARRILKSNNLEAFSQISLNEFSKIKGVGKSRASTIIAAIELSKRILKFDTDITIKTPEDVVKVVSYLRNKKREHLVALYLNARNQLLKSKIISIGTLNESLVHPREVFAPAIKYHASSVILVHNHPSGNIECSKEDIVLTENIVRSGKILGIGVSDHVIVTKIDYFSFKQKGMIYEQR
jgi:DNA repair protein RadC